MPYRAVRRRRKRKAVVVPTPTAIGTCKFLYIHSMATSNFLLLLQAVIQATVPKDTSDSTLLSDTDPADEEVVRFVDN